MCEGHRAAVAREECCCQCCRLKGSSDSSRVESRWNAGNALTAKNRQHVSSTCEPPSVPLCTAVSRSHSVGFLRRVELLQIVQQHGGEVVHHPHQEVHDQQTVAEKAVRKSFLGQASAVFCCADCYALRQDFMHCLVPAPSTEQGSGPFLVLHHSQLNSWPCVQIIDVLHPGRANVPKVQSAINRALSHLLIKSAPAWIAAAAVAPMLLRVPHRRSSGKNSEPCMTFETHRTSLCLDFAHR